MSQLLLYIHNDDSIDYRLETGNDTDIQSNVDWQSVPNANSTENIIIVSGNHVTMHQAMVPDTSKAKLAKIVPYAVEEQLIDSPDACHFAFDRVNENGSLPTAVVKKTMMNYWLTQLREQQVVAKTMLPDYLALPYESDTWHIYLVDQRAIIRLRANYGFSIHLAQLPMFLKLKIQEEFVKPKQIEINYDDAHKDYNIEQLNELDIPVKFAEQPINAITLFSKGLLQATDINLLQGGFTLTQTNNQTSKLWKVVKILGVACMVVWVIASLGKYVYYTHKLNKLQQQTKNLYTKAFPDASDVVEPELRIQRLAESLEAAKSGGNFLSLVAASGQQIKSQNNAIRINELRYNDNALELDLTADNFQRLETFSQSMQRLSINSQQTNARTTSNGVSAKITLTRGQK